ncbi:hypothetical protein NP233_g5553 [Leucocoprinus birnbaumii]|uniref:DNA-directed DNA polymerase n=1 Tax=Leucocoprinus birnbaumii TaxID=56174 RepID=A0AAD5VT12_9AGAR|nr:hypothetical protein NP233_g5553 [Leucocoprinus birnbaumii]
MEFDLEAFYRERDSIMNQPDEDFNEYRKRIRRTEIKSHFTQGDYSSNPASISEEHNTKTVFINSRVNTPAMTPGEPITPGLNSSKIWASTGSSRNSSNVTGPLSPSVLQSISPLKTITTSRVHEPSYDHNQTAVTQSSGQAAGGPLQAQLPANQPHQVSGLVHAGESAGGEYELKTRISKIGIKRGMASIQSTSPAKRSRTNQDKPIWSDFSIGETSIPTSTHSPNLPLLGRSGNTQTNQNAEQPSEILSFPSPPGRSSQASPLAARSSPIDSFSRIMTHSPSSGLRQNPKKTPKPSSGPELPYEPLLRGVALGEKNKNAAISSDKLDEDPPTSPIEDPSIHEHSIGATSEKDTKGTIASGSSKLCLEVKERVAKHAAMKQHDKVIHVGSKVTDSRIPSRSATRKDLVPKGTAIESDTSTRLGTHTRMPSHETETLQRHPRPRTTQRGRAQLKAQKTQSKPTKKEKQEPLSPIEYARQLVEKMRSISDMQYAGERTRGRMDFIVKHGGNLIPSYDPNIVTHIVTDATKQTTLGTLGYRRLDDIPKHIPTVTWNWVHAGKTRVGRLDKEDIKIKMEDVWMHAAFSERFDVAERSKDILPPKDRLLLTPEDLPQKSSRSSSIKPTSDQHEVDKGKGRDVPLVEELRPVDPLEEFYAEAREAHELNKWSQFGGSNESDVEEEVARLLPTVKSAKRGWTCDSKESRQLSIPKLQELQELHKAKVGEEDHWRAYSYNKSIRAIRNYPKRIRSYSEARNIPGVGDKTALKIMEILSTGDLRRINYERTDDVEVTRLFQGIYGVGQSTAFKWYAAGSRTLDDLRNQKGGVCLNSVQVIGLQHYDDINSRMPRSEAKAIFDLIKPLALSLDPRLFVEIMGSYRRGKLDCGDIDILITRPIDDDKTHSGLLARLLPILRKEGIITEDLAIPGDFKELECVYRGLCRLPQEGSRRRRIDFLTVPWESRGAALLYYTGDDIFNRAMRLKANKMGYSLNQRGLFTGVVRDPRDSRIKNNEGTLVASETEQEIFRILNVPWQEPHERIRG